MSTEDLQEKSLEHAWRYFELHANQRMTVFNFFLVLSGLVAAGVATSLQGAQELSFLGITLGLLLAFVSFIFWKLDQRVSFLMKRAESALAIVEVALSIESTRLFRNEPELTTASRASKNAWSRHWTYGQSFRATFWAIGTFGVLAALLSALRLLDVVRW